MTLPVCQEAIDLVKYFEGLYLNAYKCPAGVPTIGYGHTEGVSMGQTITAAEAEQFLAADLTDAAASVDTCVKVALNPQQRGALASFVFNLGAGSLQQSTLLKLLNAGDFDGAAGEFGKWVKATVNGVKTSLPGLVARRAAEASLFQTGTWAPQQTRMVAAPEGNDDNRVCAIQKVVGVTADGIYGPATKAAIKTWQAAHNLDADGIVGPKTAAAMGIA